MIFFQVENFRFKTDEPNQDDSSATNERNNKRARIHALKPPHSLIDCSKNILFSQMKKNLNKVGFMNLFTMDFKNLTEEEYDYLGKLFRNKLRKFGIDGETEDYVSTYVVARLEGRSRLQTIDQFIIDVLRSSGGDKRSKNYTSRQSFQPLTDQISDAIGDFKNDFRYFDFEFGSELAASRTPSRVIEAIILLRKGYAAAEIGKKFNVSPSRISQILSVEKTFQEKRSLIELLNLSMGAKQFAYKFIKRG